MSDVIGVGLVGYGISGRIIHAPLILATPGYRLTAIASAEREQVERDHPSVTRYDDAAQLFADPAVDMVVVATPNHMHEPLARQAILAGKHVLVEKPFVLTFAQAVSLLDLAREHGRTLSVFQNRRFDSDFLTVRQLIESGRCGDIVHFESHMDRHELPVPGGWQKPAVPGAGAWYDLGPHMLDQALLLFGLPDRLSLHLGTFREGADADDWAHAVLDYADKRVIIHGSMLVSGTSPRFIVHGKAGSIVKPRIDQQTYQLLEGRPAGGEGWGQDDDDTLLFAPDGSADRIDTLPGDHRLIYVGLREHLLGYGENPTSREQVLGLMALLEAGARSAASGTAQPIDAALVEALA